MLYHFIDIMCDCFIFPFRKKPNVIRNMSKEVTKCLKFSEKLIQFLEECFR